MNNNFLKATLLSATFALALSACKKDDPATPVEQELITTLRLRVTGVDGLLKTFNYKIENGFGSGSQGTIQIDTIKLAPNSTYTVIAQVLNEKEDPAEDVTTEVISEKEEHLFLYNSNPATGAGSLTTSNGSKDANNLPFNQTITFTTGAAGTGALTVHLNHEPTDKNGTTPQTSGGETDVEAMFPVLLQ